MRPLTRKSRTPLTSLTPRARAGAGTGGAVAGASRDQDQGLNPNQDARRISGAGRSGPSGPSGPLTGTWTLIRLIVRRDRVVLPIWILCMGLLPSSALSVTQELYPTLAQRQEYLATTGGNPGYVALYGPPFGDSVGSLVSQRLSGLLAVLAIISLLTVIRHTRTEEETGRRELIGATVVGRYSGLAAALTVTAAADLLAGALVSGATAGQGQPVAGAAALGLVFFAVGALFAAAGALAAQVTQGAGAARGLGLGALGVVMLLRIIGDLDRTSDDGAGLAWLSWLSPLGWAHRVQPFAGERWWVFALFAMTIAALTGLAALLSARRDLGAGLLPARLGPATASPRFDSAFALAWRLQRGLLIGWTATLAVFGTIWGALGTSVDDMLRDSPQLREAFTRMGGASSLVDSMFAALLGIVGVAVSAYAVQATLRLRAEEEGQRAEPLLATPVGRLRWASGHLVFALLGPAAAMVVTGLAMGLSYGIATGDIARETARCTGAALVVLPAIWVLGAVAMALFGLLPRLAPLAWAVFALCLLLGPFGSVLDLGQWALDVSPFTHVPKLPGGPVNPTPLAWMAGVIGVLTAAGMAGLRRRDIG